MATKINSIAVVGIRLKPLYITAEVEVGDGVKPPVLYSGPIISRGSFFLSC